MTTRVLLLITGVVVVVVVKSSCVRRKNINESTTEVPGGQCHYKLVILLL